MRFILVGKLNRERERKRERKESGLREGLSVFEGLGCRLWLGAIKNLKEVTRLGTHTLVYIGFGTFQMIVQIVTKHANQIDRLVSILFVEVSR